MRQNLLRYRNKEHKDIEKPTDFTFSMAAAKARERMHMEETKIKRIEAEETGDERRMEEPEREDKKNGVACLRLQGINTKP